MSLLVDELKKAEQARRKNSLTGSAEERATVQNLFAVKQAESIPPRLNKIFAIAAASLLLVATVGSGVYFGLPVKSAESPEALAPTGETLPPTVQGSLPATQSDAAPVQPASTRKRAVAATEPGKGKALSPIRISKTARLKVNQALARGYEAYLAGKLSIARSEYQQVLKDEPKNMDALHGLAAISLRQGHPDAAEGYYLRAIEANPKDALAQAGLIGLRGQRNPLQAESRLKALLAAQPELPFLNIALGNLYAGQDRWSEAQQSFFKAFIAEPDNPDTLFNLAVSLDHMRQTRPALQYYKQALAAAEKRPASFDKQQVSARLREMPY